MIMNYHNIEKNSMLNGQGVRHILWVAGCPHACKSCHNPQTWDFNGGIPYDNQAHAELLECLSDEFIDGLTLSGGECLAPKNAEEIYRIISDVKFHFPNLNIWIYSGYTFEEAITNEQQKRVLEMCDVLVDGKFEIDKFDKYLQWKGSSNQRIIDVQESLAKGEVVLHELNN